MAGFKVVAMKTGLTTKVVFMRDKIRGENYQYKAKDVDRIKEIWIERGK